MENINEVLGLLEEYVKLEKNIEVLTKTKGMSHDILKESQDYRSFLNIQYELKKQVLNGGEIIEVYKSLKNIYDRKRDIFDVRYDSMEKEYKSKTEDLEEVISNLKNSKNNLRDLIRDLNNFFNGKIIEEIKKDY